MLNRKAAVIVIIVTVVMLGVVLANAGSRGSGPSVPVKPVPTVNNPTSYPLLSDFWNGNAYFEKTQYSANPSILLDEAAPFPIAGTNTVYTYFREHPAQSGASADGIGLMTSNDGGATYNLVNNGKNGLVLPAGSGCDWDASNAITPSVTKVGSTWYMLYEGASTYLSRVTCIGSGHYWTLGDIGLATSTDGISWNKIQGTNLGLLLTHNSSSGSFECNNIGAPSITYLNNQFYVFFHGDCGGPTDPATYTLCVASTLFSQGPFAGLGPVICLYGATPCLSTYPNTFTSCGEGFRFDGVRNKVGMVHGTDIYGLQNQVTNAAPIMDIGVGAQSWDSRVNGRANVIQEGAYYYLFFEGSQYAFTTTYNLASVAGVPEGNWGWGLARIGISDIDNANINNKLWQKYQYNPIDQVFQNSQGGGMQQPYVYYLNGAYRIYVWNTGQSAYNSAVLLSGTDPYLRNYPAINGGNGQCERYHRLGFVDGNGWAQTTGVNNDYLCYGPYQSVLGANDYSSLWNTWIPGAGGIPAGNYAVTFENMIDSLNCAGDFPPGVCAPIATLDITHNSGNVRDSIFVPHRNDYQFTYTYQDFEQQFTATTANAPYEWRTFFDSHAYTRAHNVFLRQLNGRYDTSAPTASMNSLPSTSAPPSFQVSWSGSDDRTGIWSFDVQSQDNGQGWNAWQPGTTSTSATFSSAACFHTYDFRVQARDNSGYTSGYSAQTSTYMACDFGISVSPGSSTINPGGTATSTITLTSLNGFSGAVNLSPSVSPAGPIASVSPTNPSVTLGGTGTSTLTVATTSGTSTGIYTVTIQGTSGPVSHSATFTLTVIDLTLSASPSSIPADFTTASTITAQLSNNAQGITISFSASLGYFPSSTQGGSLTSCITGSSGSCAVTIQSILAGVGTITATAPGYPTHQVSVTYYDFSETISPTVITTTVGSTTTATVSLSSLNGFSGTVSLATNVSPNPAGMGCSVSPNSVTLGSSATATVTCKPTQPGIYTVVVFASSGTLTHGPTISYTVQDFTLATNSLSIDGTASAGCGHNTNSCSTTFSTSRNNDIVLVYTYEALDLQPVCTFGVTDTAGLTWHFRAGVAGRNDGWYNPTPRDQLGEFWASSTGVLTSDTITESISGCASTQYGGEYNGLQVFGISGANINNPFDPNTSLPGTANNYSNTPSVTLSTTNSNDMIIAIAMQTSYGVLTPGPGFIGGPSNTEYQFATSPVTNFPATFGDNYVWYWEEMADAITPSTSGVNVGLSAGATIVATSVNGFSGTVSLTDSPLPAGLTCSVLTPSSLTLPPSPTPATLSCTATTAGTYSVTVTATSGSITHAITVPMTFNDFSLTASLTSLSIPHGSAITDKMTLTSLNGFSGTISLTASISGASSKGPFISVSPTSVTCSSGNPGTSWLGVSTQSGTPKGTYTVTVTATSGSLTRTVVITVTVT